MFIVLSLKCLPTPVKDQCQIIQLMLQLTEFWYLFKRLWGSIFKTLDYWGSDRMFGSGALCWNCSIYIQEEIEVFNLRNIKRRCWHFWKLINNLIESISKFVIMSALLINMHFYLHFWLHLYNVWTRAWFCYAYIITYISSNNWFVFT